MANEYADVDEFKAAMGKTLADKDDVIQLALDAAAAAINQHTGREKDGFVAIVAAVARDFVGSGGPIQRIDECITVTLVAVKTGVTNTVFEAWATTDWLSFRGASDNPDFDTLPITQLMVDLTGDETFFLDGIVKRQQRGRTVRLPQKTVQVTGRWGYADVVPDQVKEATIAQAMRWFERFEVGFADMIGTPETGQRFFRRSLDGDIKQMLVRLVRPSVG